METDGDERSWSDSISDVAYGTVVVEKSSNIQIPKSTPVFQTPEFETLFRDAYAMIKSQNIFDVFAVSHKQRESYITICNVWRLHKTETGNLIWEGLDFERDRWLSGRSDMANVDLPYTASKTSDFSDYAMGRLRKAISVVLKQCGIERVLLALQNVGDLYVANDPSLIAHEGETLADVQGRLAELYCGPNLAAQAKRTMLAFRERFVGRDLADVFAYASIAETTFNYAFYLIHSAGVIRVYRETPNLLPLLQKIAVNNWSDPEIFSKQRWMRHEVTVKTGKRKSRTYTAGLFSSRSAMRWIFGSSVDVVRAWVSSGMEENVLINISRANIKCEIPERAAIDMLAYHTNTRKMGVCSAVQVMYRHFAEACEKVFREEGDEALSLFIEKEHVGFVGDWLKAQGRADGHPSKNATWTTLSRHAAIWREKMQKLELNSRHLNTSWKNTIKKKTLHGFRITAMCSKNDLIIEGKNQEHCVATYWDVCAAGVFAVFSVKGNKGERSTLGLRKESATSWVVEQHFGSENSPIDTAQTIVGNEFALLYSTAYVKAAKKEERAKKKANAIADAAIEAAAQANKML